MEIDISRSTAVRTMTVMTMASTSVIDVTLRAVGIMRGSTGGVAEMSTAVRSGGTTVAVVAAMMAVTAVVEVKMGLSDSTVAGEVTTEAIAEVSAGFASVGATLVVADIMVESWSVDLMSSSVTTVAEVAAMMAMTAVVNGGGGLLDRTVETMGSVRSLGCAEAVSGRSRDVRAVTEAGFGRSTDVRAVAEAASGRSTDVEATLSRSVDGNSGSAESSLSRGTSWLSKRAGRSGGSTSVVEGSRGTTVVRSVAGRSTITDGAPFSSGSSGNNSSESESLEHLKNKYIKSLVPNLL